MKCTNCGSEIADHAVFCTKCGTKISSQKDDVQDKSNQPFVWKDKYTYIGIEQNRCAAWPAKAVA